MLEGCEVMATDEAVAKHAGELLGHTGTADAVAAIVVATATRLAATVVTSDPKDLLKLSDASAHDLSVVEI